MRDCATTPYCRFVNSDAYVYDNTERYVCAGCKMTPKVDGFYSNQEFQTLEELQKHLKHHINSGWKIPDYTMKRVRDEISENQG